MNRRKFIAALLAAASMLLIAVPVFAQQEAPAVSAEPADMRTGSFTVSAAVPETVGAQAVYFPVWAEKDQSDIIWHPATLVNGVWSANIQLSDHVWLPGPYAVHCYAQTAEEDRVFLGAAQADANNSAGSLKAITLGGSLPIVVLQYVNTDLHPDAPVSFRITGKNGAVAGPFETSFMGSGWSAVIPSFKLGMQGNCRAEAYIGEASAPAASAGFQLGEVKSGALYVDSKDGSAGTFSIRAAATRPEEVSVMRAAIWNRPDQSDLRWIDMDRKGEEWIWTADVRDYGYAFGNYLVHLYAQYTDGRQQLIDNATIDLVPSNYLYGTTENGQYRLHLLGASSGSQAPRAAVWSAVFGNDDGKWYDMTQQADGSWQTVVNPRNHSDGKTLEVSVHRDGNRLTSMSYPEMEAIVGYTSVAAEERLQRNAEAVYNLVGRDLHEVYKYVRDSITYSRRDEHVVPPDGYTREQWYAVEGFETFQGNCYTYASTFCELAQRLGYDAQYIEGQVPSTSGWIGHGFVIVTIDGKRYICDAVFEHSSTTGRNYYMQSVEKPRTTYRW